MLEQWNNQKPLRSHGHGHEEHVDEWHHHETVEGEPQEEHTGQVNTGIILKWFVVIVVFVVASIAFIMVYFNHYNTAVRAATVETSMSSDYLSYRLATQERLASEGKPARYTGLAGGKVQGPIGDAMKQVVDQYKSGAVKLGSTLPAGHAGK
jgi:hypothetical protein